MVDAFKAWNDPELNRLIDAPDDFSTHGSTYQPAKGVTVFEKAYNAHKELQGSELVHGFVWENEGTVPLPHAWVVNKHGSVLETRTAVAHRNDTYVGHPIDTEKYEKLYESERMGWAYQKH
jgi:hypothetical protein